MAQSTQLTELMQKFYNIYIETLQIIEDHNRRANELYVDKKIIRESVISILQKIYNEKRSPSKKATILKIIEYVKNNSITFQNVGWDKVCDCELINLFDKNERYNKILIQLCDEHFKQPIAMYHYTFNNSELTNIHEALSIKTMQRFMEFSKLDFFGINFNQYLAIKQIIEQPDILIIKHKATLVNLGDIMHRCGDKFTLTV